MILRKRPTNFAAKLIHFLLLISALSAALCPLHAQATAPVMPMQPVYQNGAEYRLLQKKVLSSRLLNGMEDLTHWSFRRVGSMTLSTAEVKQGDHSLPIASTDNIGHVNGDGDWQDLVATRKFPSENWSPYNRISVWVYPDLHGAPAISINLTLHNEGAHLPPDDQNEGRDDSIPLTNRRWNHVVWEIAPLDRDKITGLSFGYALPKMFPDPADQTGSLHRPAGIANCTPRSRCSRRWHVSA